MIFVFGSNLAGRHGKGAALCALRQHGAIYGVGEGKAGNSYAIPTKDRNIQTLPLEDIKRHVGIFLHHAAMNWSDQFNVTRIGCGLAGYRETDIAPMFEEAGPNVHLPSGWRTINRQPEDTI